MTERLYYNDSYLLDFKSSVESVRKIDRGFEIVLKESAFYPDSGGQLHDTGTLDGEKVIDVYTGEDNGEVVHVLENWKADVDALVDCARRGKIVLAVANVKKREQNEPLEKYERLYCYIAASFLLGSLFAPPEEEQPTE